MFKQVSKNETGVNPSNVSQPKWKFTATGN